MYMVFTEEFLKVAIESWPQWNIRCCAFIFGFFVCDIQILYMLVYVYSAVFVYIMFIKICIYIYTYLVYICFIYM